MKVICITNICPSNNYKSSYLTVGKAYHVISSHPRNGQLLKPTYLLVDDSGGMPKVYYASQFREAEKTTTATTVTVQDGATCKKCNEFNQYVPGPSYTCYQCRN